MTKLAVIVGGVVLLAGVALAGTLTSLGSADNPAGPTIAPLTTTTTGHQADDHGQAQENEANEDLRGPCDEAEHASDPRCTGAATPTAEDRHGDYSGPGGGDDD